MNKEKRIKILERIQENSLFQKREIEFKSDFELLISLILSVRARDSVVNRVSKKLYRKANDAKKFLQIGEKKVKKYIKEIGMFNIKSKRIMKCCKIIIEKYNGEVPGSRYSLESIPGVGRKISNIILNVIFGKPTIAVDTHVFRVCNRTNFAFSKSVKETEKKLNRLVPKRFKKNFHESILYHGKKICKSRSPKCKTCVISDLCEFKSKLLT
ncbi:endonuclease III [Candidatus Riesia sp. GBBU]|nr:endonuclease III [Candidatus Riesia sp. GBBU]